MASDPKPLTRQQRRRAVREAKVAEDRFISDTWESCFSAARALGFALPDSLTDNRIPRRVWRRYWAGSARHMRLTAMGALTTGRPVAPHIPGAAHG